MPHSTLPPHKTHCHIALLLAGGDGTRAAQSVPKQYVQIEGIPVLAYTMRAFDRHSLIDEVYVVCQDEWADLVQFHRQSSPMPLPYASATAAPSPRSRVRKPS